MATGELSGVVVTASGPTNGATVSLYLSSRIAGQPAQGAAPPGGGADFGPVTSGTTFGGPGAWTITSVTEGDYYVLAVASSVNYWAGPFSVVENSDVVHITGTETITGNKEFDGTVKLGKGTAVTTLTGAGATQNTLDDGSGNTTIAGTLHAASSSTTHPSLQFDTAAAGAPSYGTNYGVDLDNNSAIAINAKAGANGGVYTLAGGTKKNTLDDGSGAATISGLLTASNGLTVSAGTVTFPNASIQPAAINGLGAGFTGAALSVSNTFTGANTFDNDVTVTGGQVTGGQLASPAAPTVTATGAAGSTAYQYAIVATTYDARDTIPSPPGIVTNGNATLNGSNYNALSWAAVTGANTYTVLKWNGTTWVKLAGGIAGTTYNDQGGSTSAYTLITVNPGGETTAQSLAMPGDLTLTGGQLIGNALGSPSAPTVTPTGGTASTNYSYKVVPVTFDGRDGVPSAAGSTTTGVAALSNTQYNRVTWTDISNCAGYRVLRTVGGATQGQITVTVLPPNTTAFNDIGITATAYTQIVQAPGGEIGSSTIGATSRFLGRSTSAGAPGSGTYNTGDSFTDSNGADWYCTAGGSPGTWITRPLGTLGYVQSTSLNQSGITTVVAVTGLSVACTIGSGRRIKVSSVFAVQQTVATDIWEAEILDGGAVVGVAQMCNGTTGNVVPPVWSFIITPTAGSHTYTAQLLRASGTGSLTANSAATFPAYVLVEDVGV